ncbi:hypothetical protein KP509_10G066000 [Ceratopteris richardii]|uniref:VWFA domain-containing protein n=1 Tax=Ceratopteris richardii TaxID=49495 RepID=A0A8T2TYB8_CERRI|nr:hypothetical protein KP509_10G066000 [Ceratopteris richardii]
MLEANLGGTEIYPPLYHVLSSKGKETHPRQVFLLTDGQVTNLNQLALLVSEHTATIRLFTFGIGNAVDRLLCKKLAEAGRGKCEFVAVEDKRGAVMREKVVRQIARALQPVLTDVTVDWGILKEPINQVEEDEVMVHSSMPRTVVAHDSFMQCPSVAPAIFMSTGYMLPALNVFLPDQVWQQAKEGKELDFECEIAFTARSNHPLEKEQVQYSVLLKASQITRAGVIHALAVKERIGELEDKVLSCSVFEEKEKMEEEVLQLAMKYTLTSSKTSFVITYSDTGSQGTEEVALSSDARRDSVAPAFHSFKRERPFRRGCKSKVGHEPLSSSRAVYRSSMSAMSNTGKPLQKKDVPNYSPLETMCSSPMYTPLEEETCCFSSVPMSSSPIPVDLPVNLPQGDELSEAFTDLISLQSANGSWQLTPELINISVSIIRRTGSFVPRALTIESLHAISNEYAIDDVSIAVILCLEILKKYFQQRQAEWEMLSAKAAFFLKNTCNMNANMQQKVEESVAKLLGR